MNQNNNVTRVTIPNFVTPDVNQTSQAAKNLVDQNTSRIDSLQQAIDDSIVGKSPALAAADVDPNLGSTPSQPTQRLTHSSPSKIDGLIDSILAKFPLSHPVTLVFVGCRTDAETDTVASDVALRLTQRCIGKVLLVDANPNSQKLSSDLGLAKTEGIGNVICSDQPWHTLLQYAHATGLDFLPYGNISTAKTLRSRTLDFLTEAKTDYQFICVSAGLNDCPISKSFCNAADGIYLLVDLAHQTHLDAKASADQILLNNLPLVGCIALDAEQDQK